MGSVNGQKIGSIKCKALIPTFQKMVSACGKIMNDDSNDVYHTLRVLEGH